MISISTKKYSTLFKRIFDVYAEDVEVFIDGKLYGDADISTLKQTWCFNRRVENTHDFWLKRDGRLLFGFHDHPAELYAAESELPFLEQLRKDKVIRYYIPQSVQSRKGIIDTLISCLKRVWRQ